MAVRTGPSTNASKSLRVVLRREYLVLDRIDQGEVEVFRLRHRITAKSAVATLWRSGAPRQAVAQAVEVARRTLRFRHPRVASLRRVGLALDDRLYTVADYYPAPSLRRWADLVGIPPSWLVRDLVLQIAQALTAIHRAGLAHEALTPDRIAVSRSPSDPESGALRTTLLGLGEPHRLGVDRSPASQASFLAPEQCLASSRADAPSIAATVNANIYSCGALLYHLSTGGAPYPCRDPMELEQRRASHSPPVPSRINPVLPPALDNVILRALAPQPRDRFADIPGLAEALRKAVPPQGERSSDRAFLALSNAVLDVDKERSKATEELDRWADPEASRETLSRPPPKQVA